MLNFLQFSAFVTPLVILVQQKSIVSMINILTIDVVVITDIKARFCP